MGCHMGRRHMLLFVNYFFTFFTFFVVVWNFLISHHQVEYSIFFSIFIFPCYFFILIYMLRVLLGL